MQTDAIEECLKCATACRQSCCPNRSIPDIEVAYAAEKELVVLKAEIERLQTELANANGMLDAMGEDDNA